MGAGEGAAWEVRAGVEKAAAQESAYGSSAGAVKMAGEKPSILILVLGLVFVFGTYIAMMYGLSSLHHNIDEHVVQARLISATLHPDHAFTESYTELLFKNGTIYHANVSACLYGYFHDRIGDWFNITVNKFGVVLEVRQ